MRLRDLEIRLLEENPLKSLNLGNSSKEISPPPTGINNGNYDFIVIKKCAIIFSVSRLANLSIPEFYLFQNHLKLTTHKIR